jgi:putative DNA primase/helicase
MAAQFNARLSTDLAIENISGHRVGGRHQRPPLPQSSSASRRTAGEAYLHKRGIDIAAVPDHGGLRWHPRTPWGRGKTTGCIISRFTDIVTGEPRGIHRRPIDGQKPLTLGTMRGCVVRLWPDEQVTIGLVLAEGIETALAASQVIHRGTLLQPIWAAGHAGNMADFPVLAGIEALTLIVDSDASGTGQDSAWKCAQRWRAAGREVVRLIPRRLGDDFNDIIVQKSA